MTALRYITAGILLVTGFLWFWPLCALAVVLLGLSGSGIVALLCGLLLDLAWGAPTGALHYIYLPFTLLGAAAGGLHLWLKRYTFDRSGMHQI